VKALIVGITGQDGAYLSSSLLKKGYEVIGTSRGITSTSTNKLEALSIENKIKILTLNIKSYDDVRKLILNVRPHEIYNLSGQTSVAQSFENPVEAYESIVNGAINILEAIRIVDPTIKYFNAGSGEIYGGNNQDISNEKSLVYPMSPYAAAKASAMHIVRNYRDSFDIFCCTGITFNHESPLRPDYFVTQKIVRHAYLISQKKIEYLELGNIDIQRDWGWAPEYVEAMVLMMGMEKPEDIIISTGKISSLKDFINLSFSYFDLNWEDHVKINDVYKRSTDVIVNAGNPSKANMLLGWSASYDLKDIVKNMCKSVQYKN
tara:strand:+ start:669 stop:1625 length:957 start_codon:yes stop_codon:yes gene_type:complete